MTDQSQGIMASWVKEYHDHNTIFCRHRLIALHVADGDCLIWICNFEIVQMSQ